jgi:hypothetical protein
MSNKSNCKDITTLKKRMRSGSVYRESVRSWILEKNQKLHLSNFYSYFSSVRSLIEETNQGTKTPKDVEKRWNSRTSSDLSNLVQKHLAAPAQDFENQKRYGSFIENKFLKSLVEHKEINVQSEHPMDRQYIHERIGTLIVSALKDDYIPSPKNICDLKSAMALVASLYFLKDDITVVTLRQGKGIERYNRSVIVSRDFDGTLNVLDNNEFYDSVCLPIQRITDICLNDFFIPLLKCEKTFKDVNDLFVNKENILYTLWYKYTESRGIDRNMFPTPFLITPDFF